MNIKDFITLSINQLREGIDSVNATNCSIKAYMPAEIEFDLAVYETINGLEVLQYAATPPSDITRIKIMINVADYVVKQSDIKAYRDGLADRIASRKEQK